MRFRSLLAAAVVLFLLAGTSAGSQPPTTITVIGLDDQDVDRQNIQDALDAAKNNDTVELVGTFQLDGTRMFITSKQLTITGPAIDNDGDGAVNEDWADGVDNDGDGSVDEDDWDATLIGVADADGSPARDISAAEVFNRGFSTEGIHGTVHHITIKNLKLSTLNRAISFSPDFGFPSLLCVDISETGGSAHHLVVENNWFDNDVRGVQFFGENHDYRVNNNLFTDIELAGVRIQGERTGCRLPDGSIGLLSIGVPSNGDIAHNRVSGTGSGSRGIHLSRATRTEISNNVLDKLRDGIRVVFGSDIFVFNNTVSATSLNGIVGIFESAGSVIAGNVITDSEVGLAFRGTASLWHAVGNNITASMRVDILLGPDTFNNTVDITEFPAEVRDLGTNNTIIQ